MLNMYTKNVYDNDEFVKPILQAIIHMIRSWNTMYGYRDSVLVCKMHDIFKHYGISGPFHQAMQVFIMNRLAS